MLYLSVKQVQLPLNVPNQMPYMSKWKPFNKHAKSEIKSLQAYLMRYFTHDLTEGNISATFQMD